MGLKKYLKWLKKASREKGLKCEDLPMRIIIATMATYRLARNLYSPISQHFEQEA